MFLYPNFYIADIPKLVYSIFNGCVEAQINYLLLFRKECLLFLKKDVRLQLKKNVMTSSPKNNVHLFNVCCLMFIV